MTKHQKTKTAAPIITITGDETGCFVVADGVKIAERKAGAWVSLEPGWRVLEGKQPLAEAAAEEGVSKSAIMRAIRSGEVAGNQDAQGNWYVATMVIEYNGVKVH
jgi:hypothetical protein